MSYPYGRNEEKMRRLGASRPNTNVNEDPKIREIKEAQRKDVLSKITFIGRVMIKTRTVTAWQDGDAMSFVLNWWNPLALVFLLITVPILFVMGGVREVSHNLDSLGLKMNDYWRARKDERPFIYANEL